ncbi:MCE family protein [Mycobacterium sp. CBMA271]|uniref:MlaD family protein n=1 Tax=unclassified Mycobacteroides TaxID=2618759 RepID=UPI0012DE8C54|nr:MULTISPECIES: MlaD family protein [unclassified Mycobacteroides]MUM19156.1 mammalian cell entry protein [Mycobacteroides sp. CBMA 326]MUM21570.1 MCE family protein [Mycobacteroides sp. CBMA 271]
MINSLANAVVGTVRAGHRQRMWLSGLALAATLLVAVAYLMVGALRARTFTSTYQVSLELPESGGLIPNQDVALRGLRIGRVDSVTPSPRGPVAVMHIESAVKIPVGSPVRVSGLSAGGEQYVDFAPVTTTGPYLGNGSVIARGQATVPVTLSRLLADADGALAQADPKKLEIIKKELHLSREAPRKMTEIIDGGVFLLSTLDSVLPETVSTLKNSRVTLSSVAEMNKGLAIATQGLNRSLNGVARMDGGFRTLIDRVPGPLATTDAVFADNSDTMAQLLGNLTTVAQLSYVRVPALNALFPSYRGSVIEAVGNTFYDHGVWAIADIYPRYTCDYGTQRSAVSAADYPEPSLYAGYCRDDDPAVLVRGAKNAPRPAGDDTAGPPQGADLGKLADPTPKGRFTIPTPYGGPTLPIAPPK